MFLRKAHSALARQFHRMQEQPEYRIRDPRDSDHPGQRNITEIQAGAYGDSSADALREQLDRLIGHRVTVKGSLFPATTGYHRTEIQLKVRSVDPLDANGEIALRTVKPAVLIRDVGAYEVVVNAGPRPTNRSSGDRITVNSCSV